jgi:phage-related protein
MGTINKLVAALAFMKQNALTVFSGLTTAVKSFVNVIIALFNTLMNAISALGNLLMGDFSGAWRAVKNTINSVIDTFKAAWDVIKGLNTMATGLVKMLPFSTPDAKFTAEHSLEAKKPGGTSLYDMSGTRLGQPSMAASSTQNNNVTTNITVQAASNPEMTAKAIANHPAIKNGDMIRNQKSPTR